jgi:hypothetical protein
VPPWQGTYSKRCPGCGKAWLVTPDTCDNHWEEAVMLNVELEPWTKAAERPVAWAEVWGVEAGEQEFLGFLVRRSIHHPVLKRKATVYEAYKGQTNKHPRNLTGRTVRGKAQFMKRSDAVKALMAAHGVADTGYRMA